jgi:hypothetical protein
MAYNVLDKVCATVKILKLPVQVIKTMQTEQNMNDLTSRRVQSTCHRTASTSAIRRPIMCISD